MTVKKKYKKLTNKEKQWNKELMTKWRKEGLIPPVKPKLNRKKFAKEVIVELKECLGSFDDLMYIHSAIRWMIPDMDENLKIKVSSEQVGVLKMIKIAVEIKKFEAEVKANGDTKYKYMDLYEKAVAPILNL